MRPLWETKIEQGHTFDGGPASDGRIYSYSGEGEEFLYAATAYRRCRPPNLGKE